MARPPTRSSIVCPSRRDIAARPTERPIDRYEIVPARLRPGRRLVMKPSVPMAPLPARLLRMPHGLLYFQMEEPNFGHVLYFQNRERHEVRHRQGRARADDIDLVRSPLSGHLDTETYVLGAFNPGLMRLPNGNLLMMVRVSEALRTPVVDEKVHAIRRRRVHDGDHRRGRPLHRRIGRSGPGVPDHAYSEAIVRCQARFRSVRPMNVARIRR